MVTYAAGYIAAFATFLIIDAIWISAVMRPIFERNLGDFLLETPRLEAAAIFYAFYIAGVLYFAVSPALSTGSLRVALLNGAILGFLAYGTYEATNMATLKGWTYMMVAIDVAWGMTLTALSAVMAFLCVRWMNG